MIKLLVLILVAIVVEAEDEYEDAVLNYLLYGDSLEVQQSNKLEDDLFIIQKSGKLCHLAMEYQIGTDRRMKYGGIVKKDTRIHIGDEPKLSGGLWKCGNCTDIDDSKLVYSEDNNVDADMKSVGHVDIQIAFTVPDMRCVTVNADEAHVVRRVSGSCSGGSVTLNVTPAHHFTIRVYS